MSNNRIMWPFDVNWRDPYEVTHAFKTDIFTREAGTENRRAIRRTARKSLAYTAQFRNDALRQFNRLMMTGHNMELIMPEMTRQATLSAQIGAEAVILPLTGNVPSWLNVGGEIVIGSNFERRLAKVAAIGVNSVTVFEAPGAFPAGTKIYHALSGRLAQTINANRMTNRVAEGRILFDVTPGSEIVVEQPATVFFAGREVLETPHNWAMGQEVDFEWPVEQVDFGGGVIATHNLVDFPTQIRGTDILLKSPAEAEALTAFFHRMRGCRGEFMRHSGESDLVPAAPLVQGQATMLVAGTETYDYFLDDPVHRAVAVRLNGANIYREVSLLALSGDNTLVTVNAPWPAGGVPQRVSWLYNNRCASDEMTLAWANDHVAQARLSSRTLPLADGFDYTALRSTPAGEDREIPDGSDRIVIYV